MVDHHAALDAALARTRATGEDAHTAEKDALREYERAVMKEIVRNAPSARDDGGDITPDWISNIATALLNNRAMPSKDPAPEPPGLGAVVTDMHGKKWVRDAAYRDRWFCAADGRRADWADLVSTVTQVESIGVRDA